MFCGGLVFADEVRHDSIHGALGMLIFAALFGLTFASTVVTSTELVHAIHAEMDEETNRGRYGDES